MVDLVGLHVYTSRSVYSPLLVRTFGDSCPTPSPHTHFPTHTHTQIHPHSRTHPTHAHTCTHALSWLLSYREFGLIGISCKSSNRLKIIAVYLKLSKTSNHSNIYACNIRIKKILPSFLNFWLPSLALYHETEIIKDLLLYDNHKRVYRN